VHRYTDETDKLARAVVEYALDRIKLEEPPLDGPLSAAELLRRAGQTITSVGLGGFEALRIFAEELAPATISTDQPRNWAFVPAAPTKASVLFDLVVGASSIVGSSWLEGAGAVFAENQALRWLSDLAGLPPEAGGVFVSGGSAGNLAGLVAGRDRSRRARAETGAGAPRRWRIAATKDAHSSVWMASRVMDVDVVPVEPDERGRLTGKGLRAALEASGDLDGLFGVVATAGTTNVGIVDDLAGVAQVCREHDLWFHVDGAYGGAGLAAPSVRRLFDGIEHADSLVIDPHKLLFAPFDCAALLYREPEVAARAHMQEAAYLDHINVAEEWSPSHYAYHLTRRIRGLPFWFSLATHGTNAYRDAIELVLQLTRDSASEIRARGELELLLDPEISVVVFRRKGWSADDYTDWSNRMLEDQTAFALPTAWKGEKLMRFCFVNPNTTIDDVRAVLDTMV
jgi:glutamate/tyrosine decarboxylase-like PLP-dependent enzyme